VTASAEEEQRQSDTTPALSKHEIPATASKGNNRKWVLIVVLISVLVLIGGVYLNKREGRREVDKKLQTTGTTQPPSPSLEGSVIITPVMNGIFKHRGKSIICKSYSYYYYE
jgi:hypothetical protein